MSVLSIEKSFMPIQQDVVAKPQHAEKKIASDKKVNVTEREQQDEPGYKLEEAVEQLNKTVQAYNTELKFTVHKESGEVAVKVIDTRDKTIIREIPPERVLDFAAHVKKMLGILFDKFI